MPGAANTAGTSGAGQASGNNATPSLESAKPSSASSAPAALVADAADREIVVETTHVRATFSTRGAVLKSWVLKHYLERERPADRHHPGAARGGRLEAVRRVRRSPTRDSRTRLQQALYKPSTEKLQLGDGARLDLVRVQGRQRPRDHQDLQLPA